MTGQRSFFAGRNGRSGIHVMPLSTDTDACTPPGDGTDLAVTNNMCFLTGH